MANGFKITQPCWHRQLMLQLMKRLLKIIVLRGKIDAVVFIKPKWLFARRVDICFTHLS